MAWATDNHTPFLLPLLPLGCGVSAQDLIWHGRMLGSRATALVEMASGDESGTAESPKRIDPNAECPSPRHVDRQTAPNLQP